jgi:AraC-like DNA-binding protein
MDSLLANISSVIAFTTLLIATLILYKNFSKIHFKYLPLITLMFTVIKFTDSISLIINDAKFYFLTGFTFEKFKTIFILISLAWLPTIFILFHQKFLKFKSWHFFLIIALPSICILEYFVIGKFYRVLFYIYFTIALLISYRALIKNKKYYEQYNLFSFLSAIGFVIIILFFGGLINTINNGLLFVADNYFIAELTENRSPMKGIVNFILIAVGGFILANPVLLHGKYYYVSRQEVANNSNSKTYKNNHWAPVRIKRLDKKDIKNEIANNDRVIYVDRIKELENDFIIGNITLNSIDDISQELNVKSSTINHLFKYYNFLTFNKFLIKLKMKKAKYLIQNGYLERHSVNQLATLMGYNSRSAFFTKFKEINGYAPTS